MPKDSGQEIRNYFANFDAHSAETKRAILLYEDVELILKLLRSGSTEQAVQLLEIRERALFLQLQGPSR